MERPRRPPGDPEAAIRGVWELLDAMQEPLMFPIPDLKKGVGDPRQSVVQYSGSIMLRRIFWYLPTLTVGCGIQPRSVQTFYVTPSEVNECAWVERSDLVYLVGATELTGLSEGGPVSSEVNLYYCCPAGIGQPPVCLVPAWETPVDRRVDG